MKHTFLFKEGVWLATGKFHNEQGEEIDIIGVTKTVHKDNIWLNDGFIELLIPEHSKFYNNYEIIPFDPDKDYTTWVSKTLSIGDEIINGKIVIIKDVLISDYHSKNGTYSGIEISTQIDEKTYESKGFLFQENKKLSSWSVIMTLSE